MIAIHRLLKQAKLVLVGIILLFHSCQNPRDEKVRLAVSSNAHFAIEEICKSFEIETGIKTEIISGSSGKLTAQILSDAPYDIFISADMKYPTKVFTKGYAVNPPKIYGYGKLILWSFSVDTLVTIDQLKNSDITKISMANPKLAPYGEAAFSALENAELYETIKQKLVFGESIAQVNQFINTRSTEVGITSLSSVYAFDEKQRGKWVEIPTDLYEPIAQGAVIIQKSNGETKPGAIRFYDFLFSSDSKEILSSNGYY